MKLEPFRDLAGRWLEEADHYAADGAIVPADQLLRRVAAELTAQGRPCHRQRSGRN
jgi:hypothetical protein